MELNNKIKPFPKYLTKRFNKIIDYGEPLNKEGIIYKRRDNTQYKKFVERSKLTQVDLTPF